MSIFLRWRHSRTVLALLYAVGLLATPAAATISTAAASKALAGSKETLAAIATRYSYALIPLGLGMWSAHYGFHFLTGGLTVLPVAQSFLADLATPLLGSPGWGMGALVPPSWLFPIQLMLMEIGLLGSLVVSYRIARASSGTRTYRAFSPWAVLAVALFSVGVWLMLQPMEMRGLMAGG